jgi:hypothetical protein
MSYSASLERVANDPPTYVLRIHEAPGGYGDDYFAGGTVTAEAGVATIRGFVMGCRHLSLWALALFVGDAMLCLVMRRERRGWSVAEYDRNVRLAVEAALSGGGYHTMTWVRLIKGKLRRVTRPIRCASNGV